MPDSTSEKRKNAISGNDVASSKSRESNADCFRPVSFVIPAHNEQTHLSMTLRSVKHAAEQLSLKYQLTVVNDASTDQTANVAIAEGADVITVDLRNIGAVRNAGAKQSIHPWMVFLDADTRLPVATLRATLQVLAGGAIGGGARVELDMSDGKPIERSKRMMFWLVRFAWQKVGCWAAGCYMFCDRQSFQAMGGFDERYFAAEELFFSRRLKKLGPFVIVSEPVHTSPRKLHNYSTLSLIRFLLAPCRSIFRPLRSQTGLEILYDDRSREANK